MAGRGDKKIRKAYKFFCNAERNNSNFSMEEIAKATGWKISTVNSYRTKKWHPFLIPQNGGFICKEVCEIPEDTFIQMHAQRYPKRLITYKSKLSDRTKVLIDKSREAALLAIQIYNNPLISFRIPGFIVQIIIAYTSLFHAYFEEKGIDYWHKEKSGKPKKIEGDNKYWEAEKCMNKYFNGRTTPETENIRFLIKLRDKIEHRFLPELDITISGFCQAALFNYENILVKEFSKKYSLTNNLMLALQIAEFSEELSKSYTKIQTEQYSTLKKYIQEFCDPLEDAIKQSPNFCFRAFLIPKIGNHASSADIALEFIKFDLLNENDMENYDKQIALIKEKKIQVADQGKYLPSQVIDKLKKEYGVEIQIHNHTKAWKYHKVRDSANDPSKCDTKYCQFSVPFQKVIYTDAWVELLAKDFNDPATVNIINAIGTEKI